MKFKKIGRMKVCTKVKGKNEQDTGFVFYSYDRGSSALEFLFRNQDYQITDLTNTTFKILLTIMQDGQEKKFTAIDSQPIIDNPESGIVTYPLPEQLLNHEGEVKGYVYLDFEDGSHSDEIAFTFTVIRSKIDSEIEEASEVYIKDFEQIKKEVFDLAEQAKEDIESLRPELEASVGQLTEQVQSLSQKVEINQSETNRLLQLIADNGLFTVNDLILGLTRGYFEFTRELNFNGKIVGSVIENPNIASQVRFIYADQFEMPTPYTNLLEVNPYPDAKTALGYEALRGNSTYGASTESNRTTIYPCLRIQWNIVEEIKRWLGDEYFEGLKAKELSQQITVVEKGLSSITPSTYAYARHGTREESSSQRAGGMSSLWYDNHLEQWIEYAQNEDKKYKTMEKLIVKENSSLFLDNQGRVNILMFGKNAEDVSLFYGKATLQFTYRIYLTDILYYKRDPTISQMQTQIQQLWNEVFKQ
ncbi:BppU family phage baseplate upper protein [Enterococcus faecium]|uniref:BppU family phage baseplate upper protein n=1 Tax=Enterococcus faecium TaxID=1352 RepID=UPI001D174946|nr:BppU family phage baseplate upper protein [Enterococcus faecium]MCC4053881.1 BppU family phage baseplate upper protein [Enterococcus faecium]NTP84176.1 BppU family phage baseplate upper protein [Enterococcus faecium]